MLVVDNGDAIRGIAEVATQLDFTVNGFVGTTPTQLADGQMANTETDMYLSGANSIVIASVTVTNTDSSARTFTLYIKPSAGTSRAISPVSLDLGVGHTFYTDGQRMMVMNLSGEVIQSWPVDDTPVNGEVNHPISSNWAFDHEAAADPHAGYVLESLLDAKGDLIAASADNTPAKVTVGSNDTVLTADSGEAAGVKWAAAAGGYTIVSKGSDESVQSNTTLQNDDDLLYAIGANEKWEFTVKLRIAQGGLAAHFKFALTAPSGAYISYRTVVDNVSAVVDDFRTFSSGTAISVRVANDADDVLVIWGFIMNGATPGNLQFQFCQATTQAINTTVKAGSVMLVREV